MQHDNIFLSFTELEDWLLSKQHTAERRTVLYVYKTVNICRIALYFSGAHRSKYRGLLVVGTQQPQEQTKKISTSDFASAKLNFTDC